MIEEYNSGSKNTEEIFAQLIDFAQELTHEEQRHISENLSEEQLAVFDLLINKPPVELSKQERKQVKDSAQELLDKLKAEKLVLDWRKHQRSRAAVRLAIEEILDANLPEVYSPQLFEQKCEVVYQHVFESYYGPGHSVYAG